MTTYLSLSKRNSEVREVWITVHWQVGIAELHNIVRKHDSLRAQWKYNRIDAVSEILMVEYPETLLQATPHRVRSTIVCPLHP